MVGQLGQRQHHQLQQRLERGLGHWRGAGLSVRPPVQQDHWGGKPPALSFTFEAGCFACSRVELSGKSAHVSSSYAVRTEGR